MKVQVVFKAGFFGYIAFSNVEILGNAIGNIQNKFMGSFLNFGFIVCVLSGFPFMLFPCRTSMYTIMRETREEPTENELNIPDSTFRYITYFILFITAWIAIAVPNSMY
jgi:sodium-coupled neutral amino acid transporter 10